MPNKFPFNRFLVFPYIAKAVAMKIIAVDINYQIAIPMHKNMRITGFYQPCEREATLNCRFPIIITEG